MGKKSQILLKHFHDATKKGKKKCSYCGWETVFNITRMLQHLVKTCNKIPKRLLNDIDGVKRFIRNKEKDDKSLKNIETKDEISKCSTKSGSLVGFFDQMKINEQVELDEILSRAIYATGAPFSLVENDSWIAFFKKIRPTYKIPSTFSVSNKLLNDEVKRIENIVEKKITDSQVLGLMCDGWSNVKNQSIINFIITTPDPVFVKSLDCKAEKHTGQYIANLMIEIIEKYGAFRFAAVVTDNASSMKAAWSIINSQFSHITTYGCLAHGFNLLIKDLLKIITINQMISQAKDIVKVVNMSHLIKAVFNEKQNKSITLKLPSNTRFLSTGNFLNSLLVNKQALRQTVIDERCDLKFNEENKKNILSDTFFHKIAFIESMISSICNAIKRIESDEPRISESYHLFLKLKIDLEDQFKNSNCFLSVQERESIISLYKYRETYCLRPVHMAAYLLDPNFHGKLLTNENDIDASEYIYEQSLFYFKDNKTVSEVMAELGNYKTKEGFFKREFLWSSFQCLQHPSIWWTAYCTSTNLSKIAYKILNLPPTSCACERSFSTHKNIHSLKRNRLTNDRAGKLVYVNYNLKMIKKSTQIDLENKIIIHNNAETIQLEEIELENDDIDESNFESESESDSSSNTSCELINDDGSDSSEEEIIIENNNEINESEFSYQISEIGNLLTSQMK